MDERHRAHDLENQQQSRDVRLAEFSETNALQHLRERGVENIDFAFAIERELDIDRQDIPADIFWLRFGKPGDPDLRDTAAVEGKIYFPKKPNHELVLFTPGFPGGNAGRFEMRYAKTFVDAGFTFATVRHNGTNLLKTDTAAEIINTPKRLEIARQMRDQHLGGTKPTGYTLPEIIKEPIPPLMSLQKKFTRIHLMGQSLGVAASYNAVSRMEKHPDVSRKIGNIVGIAGYIGGEEGTAGQQWDGLKMPADDLADYELSYVAKVGANTVTTREDFKNSMRQVAQLNERMRIPDHVGNILIFTPEDPLIAEPDKTVADYASSYGPRSERKLIIRDESAPGDNKPHSMLWIAPENLLRAVEAKVSSHGPHYVKFPAAGASKFEKG